MKKAAEKSSPKLIFFFHFKRGQWTTQIFFFFKKLTLHSDETHDERERGRMCIEEVNAVKEFIYILILYERSTTEEEEKKKSFLECGDEKRGKKNSRHTLLYLLQSKLTENFLFFLFYFIYFDSRSFLLVEFTLNNNDNYTLIVINYP